MSKAIVRRQIAIGKAYQNTFERGDGRRVLVDLMKKANLLEISVDDGAFENGRRSIVAEILAATRLDYDRLLKMAEERVAENDEQE